MALISPGLELSVTDESAYVPGAVGTVPLIFLTTEQDKVSNGSLATGTTKDNAGELQVFTSQREIISALGAPIFKQSAGGTPIHGSPLNEYGLMATYSAMGVINRAYAVRADVNLKELEATSVRPKGDPANGTNWLDLGLTEWGVYEWDAAENTFNKKTPIMVDTVEEINPATLLTGRYPISGLGAVGDYAVVTTDFRNRLYVKDETGRWRRVGDELWEASIPSISSTVASPTLTSGHAIDINGVTVTLTGTTIDELEDSFNAASGLTGLTVTLKNGFFRVHGNQNAVTTSGGTGQIEIADNGAGTILDDLGITAGTYNIPEWDHGTYVDVPSWRASDTEPRPTGSVWLKTSALGDGMNLQLKEYVADTDSFVAQTVTVSKGFAAAQFALDPIANGFSIPFGTKIAVYDEYPASNQVRLYYRASQGKMEATVTPTGLAGGGQVLVGVSRSGFEELFYYTVTFGVTVTDVNSWATVFNTYAIPEVTCKGNADGTLTLVHETGGVITVKDITGTMAAGAGFTAANWLDDADGTIYVTNWRTLAYESKFETPYKEPDDGTHWYYGDPTVVDIMINDNGWKGYKTLANDARGYNLTNTDPNGVIVTASKPVTQTDGTSIVAGDVWLDTSDLINYPKLYRYTQAGDWSAIDARDRFSQNGIAFADARWDNSGTTDIVAANYPTIKSLIVSNYLDLDAPNHKLFPRGMLLWNTRRSGFNVKKFVNNYFNENSFPNVTLPVVKDAWVSVSGLKDDQSPYMGGQAQRNMVVKAMRAAVDANIQIREEQFRYNIICAPGYPEVISNMVALNNDRKNTAFVIGDTPMTLPANSVAYANWANNKNGDGLSTADPYLAVYYPHAKTNDLSGNTIVMPASHMALRTYMKNDNAAYMWFAPAGVRRGLVDNATDIGYVNEKTGGFVRNGINNGNRDALYENKINPFTILPGVGLVCWGQKTRNPVASSMDRVNVARLVNYIRTILADVGNSFLFEPNDKITRDQIKNVIEGAINDLIAKRGIYDYLVVCDDTNNTPTRIARNELYVDIAIEPMKAVEFIYIPIRLKNPGDIAAGI
jgi:hypothetical protein